MSHPKTPFLLKGGHLPFPSSSQLTAPSTPCLSPGFVSELRLLPELCSVKNTALSLCCMWDSLVPIWYSPSMHWYICTGC